MDTDARVGNQLMMPQCVNLHKADLHQSLHLKELAEKNATQEKAHITWALAITKW